MRRTALLTIALCALAAQPAGAWVETAAYEVPGGGVADCLRAAGPGRLSLLGPVTRASTPFDLLAVGAGGAEITPLARSDLGRLATCPEVAAADGAETLLAGSAGGTSSGTAMTVRVAAPGTHAMAIRGAHGTVVAAATAPGGAAVVAWLQTLRRDDERARLLAAIRLPGQARFGPPLQLDDAAPSYRDAVAGIDASGRATVAWLHDRSSGLPVVRVASASPGAGFAAPQTLAQTLGSGVALAVTPQGRALLTLGSMPSNRAFARTPDAEPALRAYERAPGAARFAPIGLPVSGLPIDVAVALDDDGGALIGYRMDGRSVLALTRAPGEPFRDPGAIVAESEHGSSAGSTFVAFSPRGPAPPYDPDEGGVTAALGAGGTALLTWVDAARAAGAASAHVARGTLSGGFGHPHRLGSPCRAASSARPLAFADGAFAVAWSDHARTRELAGTTIPRAGGRVHVALPAAPPDVSPPPAPQVPKLTARLTDTRPLGAAEPLRVRVACHARCDVRASAIALGLPQPDWAFGGRRGGDPLELGAARTLGADDAATLTLRPFDGYDVAGVRGRAPRPIEVIACTPAGPVAQRVRLAPPPIAPPRAIPRLRGIVVRRVSGGMRVSWHTSIPARHARFDVYGFARRNWPPAAHVRRTGRGRTSFAVTLTDSHGRRLRRVVVAMRQAELYGGVWRSLRVR